MDAAQPAAIKRPGTDTATRPMAASFFLAAGNKHGCAAAAIWRRLMAVMVAAAVADILKRNTARLASRETPPRFASIILSHTENGTRAACWLHPFARVGANHRG